MALDQKTVRKMAGLARLRVDDVALGGLVDELSNIIDWVETLSEVDTDGVDPMTSASEISLHMRGDEVTDSNLEDNILQNAIDVEQGFFTVPKVVE